MGGGGKQVYNKHHPDLMDFMTFIWTGIYDKNFLIKNNITFPNKCGEDTCFLVQCITRTSKDIIVLADFYSYNYVSDNNNSLSHTFTKKQLNDYVEIYDKSIETLINNNLNNTFIKEFHAHLAKTIMGTFLRSRETFQNKKEIITQINHYLNHYSYLNIDLEPYWKIIYLLFTHNSKYALITASIIINNIFEQNWFRKLFRNKNYQSI